MKSFFAKLKENDLAVSAEHGLVTVLMIDVRDGTRFVTCQAGVEDETTFDAIEGELSCPVEWQVNTAINACEARIENGASTEEAFSWLRDEVGQARSGEFTYDFS